MLNQSTAYGALLLRLSLAAMWWAHGLLKWQVFTLPGTAAFFESVGLPGAFAYLVFSAEMIAGALLLIGWHGRLVSLAMLPVLVGASWVHLGNGWVFSNAGGGWEYPVFLIAASLVHALIGDGAHALRSNARQPAVAST